MASSEVTTFTHLHYQQRHLAQRGGDGYGQNRSGKKGADRIIPVPIGTVIRDATTGEIVGDLTRPNQQQMVAKGGRGGWGNSRFKSPTRRTPSMAEPGENGEERWLALELKLLADVGLVGLPNAGKSTVISVISNSKSKIADYPFTTRVPQLGVVRWGRFREHSFTVADIPGLIEGAHNGKGLGIQFLRHIERTLLLLHLVDVSFCEATDPIVSLETVRTELASYQAGLTEKPFMVAATKMDIAGPQVTRLQQYCKKKRIPFLKIAAVTGEGIIPLVRVLGNAVQTARCSP